MITQLYLAVGREKDGGKLVARTYSSATVFAADIDTMERYFCVPWSDASTMLDELPRLGWIADEELPAMMERVQTLMRLHAGQPQPDAER